MLPDLPELKKKLRDVQSDLIMIFCYRNFHVRYSPSILWEGNLTSVNRQNTDYDEEPMFSAHASIDINPEKDDLLTVIGKLNELGKQMAEKVEPELFRRLDAVLEKYGQITNPNEDGFQAALLDTFDKLDLPLNENGKIDVSKLTIVIHPEQKEKFAKLAAEAEADTKFMEKYQVLIAKKQNEADERENNRKLVR